jgi:hypothetical protein
VGSVGAAFEAGFAQLMLAAMAFLGAVGFLSVLPLILDRRLQFAIGSDGLFYRPFSRQTIPWSAIESIAIVQTYRQLGSMFRIFWRRHLRQDSINFDVRGESLMNGGTPFYRMGARMANAPPCPLYPIIVGHLAGADVERIARAIKGHWKGQIPMLVVGKPT